MRAVQISKLRIAHADDQGHRQIAKDPILGFFVSANRTGADRWLRVHVHSQSGTLSGMLFNPDVIRQHRIDEPLMVIDIARYQNLRPMFLLIKWPVERLLTFNDTVLHAIPFPLMLVLMFLLAWRLASMGVAIFSVLGLVVIAAMGVWAQAITTLSLIATAIVFCALIGIPIGIWCARSDRVWRIVRPVLDIMQTTPTFVYLVPVVMLFGVGTVPGEVAVVTHRDAAFDSLHASRHPHGRA